ncbi:hypothetical protein Tco_0772633 [Tanacetum coccineum]|uniref:Uncharacterized protein n=1 Tax=Tanacetum coccineum TaxID=301880 RepID=A0ABQ4ZM54_9ASTR
MICYLVSYSYGQVWPTMLPPVASGRHIDHLDDSCLLGTQRVIQLPLVLSLAFGKSADLFIHLVYETSTMDSYSFEVFSDFSPLITGNNNVFEVSSTGIMTLCDPNYYGCLSKCSSNSVMHASVDGDRGKQTYQSQMPLYSQLEWTGSSVGTAEGSAEARCSSSLSFSTSSSSLSSSDDSLS